MSENKKVLHVVTALSWRGGEQQAAYLIDELRSQIDSVVLCSEGSKMEQHCIEQKLQFRSYKKKGSIDFTYAKGLKNICSELNIDLCHLHDAHAHTFAILAAVFFGNKTPLILSRRVDFPIKNNWFSKFKYNHPSIAKILCVSKMIQKITAKGISDVSKLETVYSGIDLNKFSSPKGILRQEFQIPKEAFLIGNTSALADHKDYYTFLDAAEMVIAEESNSFFIIMGDGPLKKEIQDYANTKTLENRLVFTGFRNDIPQVLGELDLFLISSKTEGLGTSILDAFACNVPVVACNAGGIPELVENEKTGLLCEVKDVKALHKAVIRLMKDLELGQKLTLNTKDKLQGFSKTHTAQKTLKQYWKVLS